MQRGPFHAPGCSGELALFRRVRGRIPSALVLPRLLKEIRHQLLHQVRYLRGVTVHVDPADEAGELHHQIAEHAHDGLALHSH